MKSTLAERLARCDYEIALAIAESARPHTVADHAGILLWEMDWRIERENILEEMAVGTDADTASFSLLQIQ